MKRAHYRLEVWRKSVDFVTEVYKISLSFPEAERFGLVSQMLRASVSIPGNIAEGAARDTKKGFNNFLSIAQGSVSELETQLIISENLGYIEKQTLNSTLGNLADITKMLIGLKKSLKKQ